MIREVIKTNINYYVSDDNIYRSQDPTDVAWYENELAAHRFQQIEPIYAIDFDSNLPYADDINNWKIYKCHSKAEYWMVVKSIILVDLENFDNANAKYDENKTIYAFKKGSHRSLYVLTLDELTQNCVETVSLCESVATSAKQVLKKFGELQ